MAGGFLFNFSLDVEAVDEQGLGNGVSDTLELEEGGSGDDCNTSVPISKVVPILPCHKELPASCIVPCVLSVSGSGTKLYYISGQHVQDIASKTDSNPATNRTLDGTELKSLLTLSDSQHSDLIPGIYEGGLKLWECALDLVHFLSESDLSFCGMKILELGCGIGLPGIYTATRGAKAVHFQDYNAEVLNYVTIPSVMLNTGSKIWNETGLNTGNGTKDGGIKDRVRGSEAGDVAGPQLENGGILDAGSKNETGIQSEEERFKFYSGDWNGFISALDPTDRYDLILTSETIYSLDSQPKLLSVLKRASSEETGVVYVAAKTFYFGVGGGIESFCRLVESDGTFSVHQCREIGASIPRVILKLTHEHKHRC